MKPIFDVSAPLLNEALIEKSYWRYARLTTTAQWLTGPGLILAALAGFKVFSALSGLAPMLSRDVANMFGLLLGMLVAGGLGWLIFETTRRFKRTRLTYSSLPPEHCQLALDLIALHPELETYRRTVAEKRLFTYGDLEAMQTYARKMAQAAAEAAEKATQLKACETLYRAQ